MALTGMEAAPSWLDRLKTPGILRLSDMVQRP